MSATLVDPQGALVVPIEDGGLGYGDRIIFLRRWARWLCAGWIGLVRWAPGDEEAAEQHHVCKALLTLDDGFLLPFFSECETEAFEKKALSQVIIHVVRYPLSEIALSGGGARVDVRATLHRLPDRG